MHLQQRGQEHLFSPETIRRRVPGSNIFVEYSSFQQKPSGWGKWMLYISSFWNPCAIKISICPWILNTKAWEMPTMKSALHSYWLLGPGGKQGIQYWNNHCGLCSSKPTHAGSWDFQVHWESGSRVRLQAGATSRLSMSAFYWCSHTELKEAHKSSIFFFFTYCGREILLKMLLYMRVIGKQQKWKKKHIIK